MKKALVCITLLVLVCSLGVLVACENKTNYPIDFPQDKPLPEGVESITLTNGASLGNNGYYFDSGKGGSFFVSVKFKPGYEEGNFAVLADGKQSSVRNKNELEDCLMIDYEVHPTAKVTISWSGKPVLRSRNVTFEYKERDEGEESNVLEYSFQYTLGEYSSDILTASTLKELKEKIVAKKTSFTYGTKLIFSATYSGGQIAFPQDSILYYSETKYTDKITSKIQDNKSIKTWEKIVEHDMNIEFSPRKLSEGIDNNESSLVELGNIFNSEFVRLWTMKDIYDSQGKLYARLNDSQAIYYLKDNYKKVEINGVVEDGKFLYRQEDGRWYLELKKPNEYALEKADGYKIDFDEKVIPYLMNNPKFVNGTINIDFKSNIMDWGADTYLADYYWNEYLGYRLKDGKELIGVCFAKTVNNIKVVINGNKEFVFNNINDSSFDVERKDGVTLYNANGDARREIKEGLSIHNGKEETHNILIDQAIVGELKSIEILPAD